MSVEQDVVGSSPTSLPLGPFFNKFTSKIRKFFRNEEKKVAKYNKFNNLSDKKRKKSPTVEESYSDFLVSRKGSGCTEATIRTYRDTLKPFITFCNLHNKLKLSEVDSFFVNQYFANMSDDGHGIGGLHAYYRNLRTFLRWAWNSYNFDSEVPTNTAKVKNPPQNPIPGVPEDAFRKILDAASKTEYSKRDKAFIMFLGDTGVRKQEAANIRLKDVNLQTGEVFIEWGKGRKNRNVHVGARTRKALQEYLDTIDCTKVDDPFWVSKDGYKMTPAGLNEVLRRIQKSIGMEPMYSMHDFRRYCALNMYRRSHNLLQVSLYLGHSSVEVTRRYLDLQKEDALEFGETYSNMDALLRERPKKK